jgi:hypothetical protein
MTGQLPPCAYNPAACGWDDDPPGTCPCLEDAPTELWAEEPPPRPVETIPTGSYL